MIRTPYHKQRDPAKAPGQGVNPINTDMMDSMMEYSGHKRPAPVPPPAIKEEREWLPLEAVIVFCVAAMAVLAAFFGLRAGAAFFGV